MIRNIRPADFPGTLPSAAVFSQGCGHFAHQFKFIHQIAVKNETVFILLNFEAQPVTQSTPACLAAVMTVNGVYIVFQNLIQILHHRRIMGTQSIHIAILQIILPRHYNTDTFP